MAIPRDFTRGGQLTMHTLRMMIQAGRTVVVMTLGSFVCCAVYFWFKCSTSEERHFLPQYAMAQIAHIPIFEPSTQTTFEYTLVSGEVLQLSTHAFIHHPWTKRTLKQCRKTAFKTTVYALLASSGVFFCIVGYFIWNGIQQRRTKTLKGSMSVSVQELNTLIRKEKKYSDLKIGGVSLIKESETQHVLLCGATGTGKSVAMLELMDQVRKKQQKAIIYDIDGSFLSLYYRPGQDVLLNPLDERGVSWDIWQEGGTEQDFEAMAASLIADGGHDPFWSNAARMVFSAAAKQLAQQDKKTNAALVKFLMTAPLGELTALLEGTKAATLVEGAIEKTALSIRATLASYCGALSLLNAPIARARIGLFEEKEKHQKALKRHLISSQSERGIGKAYSGADCFFDVIAQQLAGKTHKDLRILCHEAAREAAEGKEQWTWLKALVEKEGSTWQDYCTACQYTSDEIKELVEGDLLNGTAISGRPHIEGRVICQKLSMQLHLIEVIETEEKIVLHHQFIDDKGSKTLDESSANKTYNDPNVVHVVVCQGSLHMVPLIKLIKKEGVAEASSGLKEEQENPFSIRRWIEKLVPLIKPIKKEAIPETSSSSKEENLFSIRKWIEKPDDSWLFICSNQRSLQSLSPLMSAWLDSAARALLSLTPSFDRRVWLFMDEFTSLHRLPSMESLVTRGRKYGACVVAALQNIHQVHDVYGRNEAMSLLSNFNTMIFYRVKCPDTARWMSRVTGDYERIEQKEGYSYGANEIRDGVSIHQEHRKEPVVSETQFLSLNDLSAYLILCGNWPVVLLEFKPKERIGLCPALVPKEVALEEKPPQKEAQLHQKVGAAHTSASTPAPASAPIPNEVHPEAPLEEKNNVVAIASKEVLEDKPVIETQVLEDAVEQNGSKPSHKRGRPKKEPLKPAEQHLGELE